MQPRTPCSKLRTWPLVALVATVSLVLAGCLGDGEGIDTAGLDDGAAGASAASVSHVLDGAVEPEGLEAPVFRLLGAVGSGGPGYGAGEPSIWAHLDGTLYLAFPGCEQGLAPAVDWLVLGACQHGPVYRSDDGGDSWTRLNDETTGRLTNDGPAANGDNDVAVDAAGAVYASNLGSGIQVLGSWDRGESWSYLADVVPDDHWADRQWMAAGAPGQLIMTWMGGEDGGQRAVAVTTTFDGGQNWTDPTYHGEAIGWIGTVQLDPSGQRAYIPFTESSANGVYGLRVARSLDAGASWDVVDTGVDVHTTATGQHWSGVLMAPALDITGDGTVVYVWSEEVADDTGLVSTGSVVKLVASTDHGETWGEPVTVSQRAQALMPWVTGGAGDRVAITYFASDTPGDPDRAGGDWDVQAIWVDGVATDAVEMVGTVVETSVHQGSLCSRGGACLTSGSDRALLDFFESDLLPDGRLIVTYPADPLTGAKYIDIRVAVQDGGSPLMVPG